MDGQSDQLRPASLKPSDVVLLVHGIRTHGDWEQLVAARLKTVPGVEVIPLKYRYFDLVRFLMPLWTRAAPLKVLKRKIDDAEHLYPDARISVIAHSFGTYAICRLLLDNPNIRLDRLVLCGSIVPEDFRWDRIKSQLNEKVVNDCGVRDIWPALATSTTWGYGASGTFGFGDVLVVDRFYDFGHSGFFTAEFINSNWWVDLFSSRTSLTG